MKKPLDNRATMCYGVLRMKEAHVVIRIEQTTLKQLKKMAKDQDLSVSWLIRKAINRLITEAENAGKS
jgi:predicted DNA-binding ribbon-helix-helix protein